LNGLSGVAPDYAISPVLNALDKCAFNTHGKGNESEVRERRNYPAIIVYHIQIYNASGLLKFNCKQIVND
jgi:hypothetical protein